MEAARKRDLKDSTMQIEPDSMCEKAYGCIHVKVGDEKNAAQMLQTLFPEVEAHAITQIKHKSCNGVRSYSTDIMVPGYILFNTYNDIQVSDFLAITSVYKILMYNECEWHLQGDDLAFARWVFEYHGTIGVSVVFMEGDVIQIINGPLKTIEGKIVRIDKRNRNALVSLGFNKQAIKAWLAFEWMEKASKN